MENYNNIVTDITYMSEILHFVQNRLRVLSEAKDELTPPPLFVTRVGFIELGMRASITVDFILKRIFKKWWGVNSHK